jgi:hypothetical protein
MLNVEIITRLLDRQRMSASKGTGHPLTDTPPILKDDSDLSYVRFAELNRIFVSGRAEAIAVIESEEFRNYCSASYVDDDSNTKTTTDITTITTTSITTDESSSDRTDDIKHTRTGNYRCSAVIFSNT